MFFSFFCLQLDFLIYSRDFEWKDRFLEMEVASAIDSVRTCWLSPSSFSLWKHFLRLTPALPSFSTSYESSLMRMGDFLPRTSFSPTEAHWRSLFSWSKNSSCSRFVTLTALRSFSISVFWMSTSFLRYSTSPSKDSKQMTRFSLFDNLLFSISFSRLRNSISETESRSSNSVLILYFSENFLNFLGLGSGLIATVGLALSRLSLSFWILSLVSLPSWCDLERQLRSMMLDSLALETSRFSSMLLHLMRWQISLSSFSGWLAASEGLAVMAKGYSFSSYFLFDRIYNEFLVRSSIIDPLLEGKGLKR